MSRKPKPMQRFEPTKEQRAVVKLACAHGMPWDSIRLVIINPRTGKAIAKETLMYAFEEELAAGKVEMDIMVCGALAQSIKEGNVTSMIWYMKNRMGWADSQRNELSGPNGQPLVTGIEVQFVVPKKRGDDELSSEAGGMRQVQQAR